MIKVNSKKTIRRLGNRSFQASKTRNIIAVIAIALTAILFTALFTVGSGMVENMQQATMRQAGGDGMAVLKYINDEEYNAMKDHPLIEEISYNRMLADSIDNIELIKRHGELYYMDDVGIKLGFCEPTGGHKPQAANEIMMDTRALEMLGVEQEVGAPITLEMTLRGKQVRRDFVLSGWWEADPLFNASIMVTSKAYTEAHADELNAPGGNLEPGIINSYIMFKNSFGLESKLEQVITDSGYSLDETDPNGITHNLNWAYVTANIEMTPSTVAGILAALLLIIFTGYLIIYNIFQISVIKDIRFYGLLKTIGTTGKQIKKIIRRQALLLSCIGIPIGLVIGFFLGCSLVPLIMNETTYGGAGFSTSANPVIFISSAVFALITVAISTAKPGRIAAKVSPVEAVRYTETTNIKKKSRKTSRGSRVRSMAFANLGRSRKRTVLVVISMSLSLILFNSIYTLSIGFDMDKYLSKFVDTDYLVAHADYFNYEFSGPDNSVSESIIAAAQAQPGFEEGGRFFGNIRDVECFRLEVPDGITLDPHDNLDDDGNVFPAVYGLEDLPLERLEVLEGEIDMEKLKSGKYILEGVMLDDNEQPYWDKSHYDVGDTVTLHNYKGTGDTADENEYQTYEFEVMAKVAEKHYTNTCGVGYDFQFYLPANVYKGMVAVPGVMSYVYNVADADEPAMDNFLKNYTEKAEPMMAYSSKSTREGELESTRNMFLIVGGALSLIIGLIGVLNFINSMLTSIIIRRQEFAMLQSIGMTKAQLRRMLMVEGLCYTAVSGLVSVVFGVILSKVIVQGLTESMWFCSYNFTLLPLIITIPILLLIGLALPPIILKNVERQSIVERLRQD